MLGMGLRIVIRGITRRFRRSAVVFTGIAFAVASLVTLEAIMQGVTDAMIRNSVALHHGHVNASWQGGVDADTAAAELMKAIPDAQAALPRQRLAGTLVRDDRQVPIMLYGVEPSAEGRWTVVSKKMLTGKYLIARGEIVLGSPAAEALGVPVDQQIEFWRKGASAVSYRVAGIYRTSIDQLDRQMCFARLGDVPGAQRELAVFLPAETDSNDVAALIKGKLPSGAQVRTWQESLTELVQLTALNQVSMNVVLCLALLILAFGVANAAYISVNERMREFGILKTIGVTPSGIMMLVQGEIFLLVGLAALAGIALGAAVSILWAQWGLDLSRWTSANRHFIASSVIYPRLVGRGIVLPLFVAIACGLLAGSLPARRAGRVSVVEALRQI